MQTLIFNWRRAVVGSEPRILGSEIGSMTVLPPNPNNLLKNVPEKQGSELIFCQDYFEPFLLNTLVLLPQLLPYCDKLEYLHVPSEGEGSVQLNLWY